MNREVRLTVLAFILAVATPAQQAIGYYQLIDLGSLGGTWSEARSINNNGQIVGLAYDYDSEWNTRATLFDPTGGGKNIRLGSLGGIPESAAYSINNLGQIVGYAYDNSGFCRATLFDSTGGGHNTRLDLRGYDTSSYAESINDRGQIVGYSYNSLGYPRPGYWRATSFDPTGRGRNIDLGTLDGNWSFARSINNHGQIVGQAGRAVLFDPTGGGNNIDLGTLGGEVSEAWSINDQGQIVGRAYDSSGNGRATLFDPTGGGNNIDLGTLDGRETMAYSINNYGQIVGAAYDRSWNYRATLFDPTGGGNNIDLNTLIDPSLGWTLREAYSINDNGWIVGVGSSPASPQRAWLLIPEPASAAIMVLGATLIASKRRRQ